MLQLRSNKQNILHECAKKEANSRHVKVINHCNKGPQNASYMVSNLKNFPGEHAPGILKQHRAFGAQRSPPTIPSSPATHFLIESPEYPLDCKALSEKFI